MVIHFNFRSTILKPIFLSIVLFYSPNQVSSQEVVEIYQYKSGLRKDCDVIKAELILFDDSTYLVKMNMCKGWFNYDNKEWKKHKHYEAFGTYEIKKKSIVWFQETKQVGISEYKGISIDFMSIKFTKKKH